MPPIPGFEFYVPWLFCLINLSCIKETSGPAQNLFVFLTSHLTSGIQSFHRFSLTFLDRVLLSMFLLTENFSDFLIIISKKKVKWSLQRAVSIFPFVEGLEVTTASPSLPNERKALSSGWCPSSWCHYLQSFYLKQFLTSYLSFRSQLRYHFLLEPLFDSL